jgi:hypothetical protein
MLDNTIKTRIKALSQQLPGQASDEDYATTVARLNTLIGGETRNFARIQQCKKEWDQLAATVPVGQGFLTFEDYIREYYGIKLTVNHKLGGIDLDYVVVDEKKYTVFLLRFGS